jgi:hypothetical protein
VEIENKPVSISRGRGNPGWLPGVSGNPGGRPKGLAELVKAETRDGAELIDFYLRVLRGKRQPMRYRLEAAARLADRGFGKALQQMELTGPEGGPMEVVFRYVNDWRSQGEPDQG